MGLLLILFVFPLASFGGVTQAALTVPTPNVGTVLGTINVAFEWTSGTNVTMYQFSLGTTGPGSSDLYYSGWMTGTSVVVPILPNNGVTVYARLYSRISGVWQSTDYTYTESGTPAPAVLTTPTPGPSTVLGISGVTFGWTTGSGVTMYQFALGTTGPGSSNIYFSGWTTSTSVVVPSVPQAGVKVYARLYSRISGEWQFTDYTYTESGTPVPPVLNSPSVGTVVGTSGVTFGWTTGTGVTMYQFALGTTGPGSSNLYYTGWTLSTSAVVPSVPANGVTIYARLYYRISGAWQFTDYTYTESGTPVLPVLNSPTVGTVVGTSNVSFGWTAGSGITMYQFALGTTGPGASDLYLSGWTTGTSAVVPSVPSNGVTIYARLFYNISGTWQFTDYTYTESGTPTPPVLTSPTPNAGTVVGTSNISFGWTTGAGITYYQLALGTTGPGSSNICVSGWTTNTSVVVPSVPANGVTIYARLYYRISGAWQFTDYTYTESGTPAQAVLTSPTPGLSTVVGTSGVTFGWTTGTGVTMYQFALGTTGPGTSDLYYTGWTTSTSVVVPTVPANGATIYARLYSRISGAWQFTDYTYTESGTPAKAVLTTPTPGLSTVLGSSNVTFGWTTGTGVTMYQFALGTTGAGSSNLYYSGWTTGTSVVVPTVPQSGATVYARVYSRIDGAWQYNDYVYTEDPTMVLTISSSSVAFGNVEVNTAATQSVTMTSTGSGPVTVSSAVVSGTGFTVSGATFPLTLNPTQQVTLSVQFDPTSGGAATGQLTITSNSSTGSTAVVGLTGTGTTPVVNLSWNAPSSSADPVAGYNVYRAPVGSLTYTLLNSTDDTLTTYVDNAVQNGQNYDYIVESVDSAGVTSVPSNMVTVTVP